MAHMIDYSALLDRVAEARGGTRETFSRIDPARTAHLVVDMQNGFMEEGAPVEVPQAREIVDNINRLSRAVREGGGTNIFLQYTTKDLDTGWSVMRDRLGISAEAHREGFRRGAHYWQLWSGLDVSESDLRMEKSRFSAFAASSSPIDAELRRRGIDTVIVTGTLTNCCCESTTRDAMQHNYRAVIVTDANAALSDAEHEASLYSLGFIFADLWSTEKAVAKIGGA